MIRQRGHSRGVQRTRFKYTDPVRIPSVISTSTGADTMGGCPSRFRSPAIILTPLPSITTPLFLKTLGTALITVMVSPPLTPPPHHRHSSSQPARRGRLSS